MDAASIQVQSDNGEDKRNKAAGVVAAFTLSEDSFGVLKVYDYNIFKNVSYRNKNDCVL